MNVNFLIELFACCFIDRSVSGICLKHLKYSYLSVEEFRIIWKAMSVHHTLNGKMPTIGIIAQKLDNGTDVGDKISDILVKISGAMDDPDLSSAEVLKSLEHYIKESISTEFFEKFCDSMNEGKPDQAHSLMSEYSDTLSCLVLAEKEPLPVFAGFEDRIHNNYIHYTKFGEDEKIPTGIDPLDHFTDGGIVKPDIACMMMRSGIGKSRFLKSVGVYASMVAGCKVAHIQAEGTEKECMDAYDVTWTGEYMNSIRRGDISDKGMANLIKRANKVTNVSGGEIFVRSFEKFNTASMYNVYDIVRELTKRHDIDMVMMDYLELIDPANNITYSPKEERHRRLAIANDFKNLCMEFGVAGWTVTQANEVNPKLLNDPEFYMTRSNTSECKSLVNPFSYFLTGNQTADEYDEGIMRLFHEKLRHHKSQQLYPIYQDYERGQFYDRRRTREYLDELGIIDIFDRSEGS